MRRGMWRRRASSKPPNRCFPRASTDSIRAPSSRFSSSARRTSGTSLWNAATRDPCNALRRAVAARKRLSPSGISAARPSAPEVGAKRTARRSGWRAQAQPECVHGGALQVALVSRRKSRGDEQWAERRGVHWLAVHPGDEQCAPPAGIDEPGQRIRERPPTPCSLGLLDRQEGEEVLLAPAEPGGELARGQHDV